jgi:hypothetical protein
MARAVSFPRSTDYFRMISDMTTSNVECRNQNFPEGIRSIEIAFVLGSRIPEIFPVFERCQRNSDQLIAEIKAGNEFTKKQSGSLRSKYSQEIPNHFELEWPRFGAMSLRHGRHNSVQDKANV